MCGDHVILTDVMLHAMILIYIFFGTEALGERRRADWMAASVKFVACRYYMAVSQNIRRAIIANAQRLYESELISAPN